MKIYSIGTQNSNQNNVQKKKNPNFKKFCGIDREFYSKLNAGELNALLEEAKYFANSKFCDIKYAIGPYSALNVAIRLKNSPILNQNKMLKRYLCRDKGTPIDTNTIGWQTINTTGCDPHIPYYIDFSPYEGMPNCPHYVLPDIDYETVEVYKKIYSDLEEKWASFPKLRYGYQLREGLAFAYAYEAYWTRQESEHLKKNKLNTEFEKLMEN